MTEYKNYYLEGVPTPRGVDVSINVLAHGHALEMFEAVGPGEWAEEEYVQYSSRDPVDYENFLVVGNASRSWYYAGGDVEPRIFTSLEDATGYVESKDTLIAVDRFMARVRRYEHENGFAEHHIVDIVPGVPPHSVIHVAAHFPENHEPSYRARDHPIDFPLFELLCCLDEMTASPASRFSDYCTACAPFWAPPLWIKHRFHFNVRPWPPFVVFDEYLLLCYEFQGREEASILLYKTFVFHSMQLLETDVTEHRTGTDDAVFHMTPEIEERVAALWRRSRDTRMIPQFVLSDWI